MEIKLNKELQQILEMVVSGMTSKDIAIKLNYSKRTIDYKIKKLFNLYRVESRLQLANKYVKQSLVDF